MSVFRKVVNREIGDQTVTETLECDHENILYRQVRGSRVTWCTQAGAPTGLSTVSRQCPSCEEQEETEKRDA